MSKKVLLGSLPSSDKLKYKSVTTSIFEMSKKDATYWDKEVQPLINIESKYTVRADACWKWVSFYSSLSRAVRLSKSPSSCFVLKSKSEINKKWYPISMLMVRKPCPALHNNENNSSYLWFLSTAPRFGIWVVNCTSVCIPPFSSEPIQRIKNFGCISIFKFVEDFGHAVP